MAASIAGVLAGAAVPTTRKALVQQRLRSGRSDLYATFHLARSEAIRRSSPVAVTPVDAQDGSRGRRVFVDRNDSGAQDADEETIVEWPLAVAGMSIRSRFSASFAGTVLSCNPEGRSHRPGGHGPVSRGWCSRSTAPSGCCASPR